jgi:hypothetical protein
MAKKKTARLLRSKDDIKLLKTMAKQNVGPDRIAKSLKRTPAAVTIRTATLGVPLSMRA